MHYVSAAGHEQSRHVLYSRGRAMERQSTDRSARNWDWNSPAGASIERQSTDRSARNWDWNSPAGTSMERLSTDSSDWTGIFRNSTAGGSMERQVYR